jgi:hypothetical protein
VTRARATDVPRDPEGARRVLAQARRALQSADLDGVDPDSGYGLAYQAALKAALALLRAHGRRVSSGAGGHVVTLEEARRLLGPDGAAVTRVDRMRRARNQLVYDGDEVGEADRRQAVADARVLIELVSNRLAG